MTRVADGAIVSQDPMACLTEDNKAGFCGVNCDFARLAPLRHLQETP
jgi:hypothetical protein